MSSQVQQWLQPGSQLDHAGTAFPLRTQVSDDPGTSKECSEVLKMPLEKYATVLALTAQGSETFGAMDSTAMSLLALPEIREVRHISEP